jgi:hypothetical protein
MRAYAHDARVLLNIYSKEFSYELAEIPAHMAKPWLDMMVPAVAAGYWHAYNFTPQDYARWASVGIRGAPLAAYWRRARFDPEDAVQWYIDNNYLRLASFDPAILDKIELRPLTLQQVADKADPYIWQRR